MPTTNTHTKVYIFMLLFQKYDGKCLKNCGTTNANPPVSEQYINNYLQTGRRRMDWQMLVLTILCSMYVVVVPRNKFPSK